MWRSDLIRIVDKASKARVNQDLQIHLPYRETIECEGRRVLITSQTEAGLLKGKNKALQRIKDDRFEAAQITQTAVDEPKREQANHQLPKQEPFNQQFPKQDTQAGHPSRSRSVNSGGCDSILRSTSNHSQRGPTGYSAVSATVSAARGCIENTTEQDKVEFLSLRRGP